MSTYCSMSTTAEISEAIKAARKGIPFKLDSLNITLRLKPPRVSDALEIRKLEASSESFTIATIVDVMIKAIAICTNRSEEDAETFFIYDDFERGELGKKCLKLCGCMISLKVLESVYKRAAKEESKDDQKSEVFT